MRNCFTSVAAVLLVLTASLHAQAAIMATYDYATGELILADAMGEVGFRLNSTPQNLVDGAATSLGGATDGAFGVLNDQSGVGFIEWGNLIGMTFPEARSAGFVIVPGTAPGELEFLAATAANPTSPVAVPLNVVNLPEPASAFLVVLGVAGMLTTRRRRRS